MSTCISAGPVSRALVALTTITAACGPSLASESADPKPPLLAAADTERPEPTLILDARGSRDRFALLVLMGQMDRLAAQGLMPALCFVSDPTPEQLATILGKFHALPPTMLNQPRYFTTSPVWAGGSSGLNSSGRAVSAQLTYSFMPDGTMMINCNTGLLQASNLDASFVLAYGANNQDKGRELIRQAFAGWRRWAGLSYTELPDDGAVFNNSTTNSALRGTCRIGGVPEGNTGILACNYFPSGGADMSINSTYFSSNYANASNNYRYLRNVVAHEHGHGLGAFHPVPCNNTKLMEPFINTNFDLIQIDDDRFGQRNYGDRFVGNTSAANATDFGDLTSPALKSVIERNLSTNGVSGFNSSNQDWFKFTLSSTQSVTITVQPTGGSYLNGSQSSGCSTGLQTTVNAGVAGNPDLELRDTNGNNVLQSSTQAAGSADTITTTLGAGTYWVKVIDAGPNFTGNGNNGDQVVQLYDLTIRVATSKAPPKAYAGINKRCLTGKPCFFMGDINSYATETGAAISSYMWDLDGDNLADSAVAQPTFTYNTPGVYNAKLTVADNTGSGLTGSDTIQVTVFNNDECGSAFTWGSGLGNQPFTNSGLTNSAAPDPTGVGSCTGTIANDAWYIWTAPQGGVLTAQTDAVFGARLAIYSNTTCPPSAGALIGCTQANQPVAVGVSAGQGYLFQVGSMLPGQTGSANVNLSLLAATGACCLGDGSCVSQTLLGCAGVYQGDNSPCVPNPCPPPPTGACCLVDGSCVIGTVTQCAASGGDYQGDNLSCVPNFCPQPPSGACCFADGSCQSLPAGTCTGQGGTAQTAGSVCNPNPCPQPRACCFSANGSCQFLLVATCTGQGGTAQSAGSVCNPNPCPRACCFSADGSCQFVSSATCAGLGGTAQSGGSVCNPNTCPPPTGACCANSACSSTSAAQCTGAGKHWAGANTICNVPGNNTSPCCRADFNQSGSITVQDVFEFLAAWFAQSAAADFNRDLNVTPQDIFDYLAAFFAKGCP